jgi:pyocin large subunit-like protein
MYNLSVAEAHTFFVGHGQWLVHNAECWKATGTLSSTENAPTHWNKHKSDFPHLNNSLEYVHEVNKFLTEPPEMALIKARSNGDIVIYDPVSNIFAVGLSDGTPRTMFVPEPAKHGYATNLEYFYAQLK